MALATCPKCMQTKDLPDAFVGKRVRCRSCNIIFVVAPVRLPAKQHSSADEIVSEETNRAGVAPMVNAEQSAADNEPIVRGKPRWFDHPLWQNGPPPVRNISPVPTPPCQGNQAGERAPHLFARYWQLWVGTGVGLFIGFVVLFAARVFESKSNKREAAPPVVGGQSWDVGNPITQPPPQEKQFQEVVVHPAPKLPTPAVLATSLVKVSYIKDVISSKNGRILKLLGGSVWELGDTTFALVTDDIVIVVLDNDGGIAYLAGDVIPARRLNGTILPESGLLGRVELAMSNGAVLKLNDGSLWSVSSFDQFHTSYWLPPYPVLIKHETKLTNLKKMKTISVEKLK